MTPIEQLEARIAGLGSAVVAFSGGVDSSLVAALAARTLGPRALAVTAVSPSMYRTIQPNSHECSATQACCGVPPNTSCPAHPPAHAETSAASPD